MRSAARTTKSTPSCGPITPRYATGAGGRRRSAGVGLRPRWQALRVRAGADDRHVVRLPCRCARSRRARYESLVDDHVVGGAVRRSLEQAQPAVREGVAAAEPRLVQLRAQVVVVEHEPRPVERRSMRASRPEHVRRVARLDHVERPAASRACSASRAVARKEYGVLGDEVQPCCRPGVRPVLVDGDAVDHLVRGVTRALRADDRRRRSRRASSARHSSHTRRSNGTGRFWTIEDARTSAVGRSPADSFVAGQASTSAPSAGQVEQAPGAARRASAASTVGVADETSDEVRAVQGGLGVVGAAAAGAAARASTYALFAPTSRTGLTIGS